MHVEATGSWRTDLRPARALATSSVQYSSARGREKERYTKVESTREKEKGVYLNKACPALSRATRARASGVLELLSVLVTTFKQGSILLPYSSHPKT
ncbi:hypothetical protein EVAR_76574_1 [Eumeta japonica]|uniref:Uncharacterized protein n=1 Tax=Eumeta variegata TaxID=151549 RepID=A0A4C1T4Z3_EUMVA|nr:hypothetical protein EVAR_76574_1 [Eumeta japonica]